jgi:hypothetical protein
MALNKLISALLFLVLIFAQKNQHIEGRRLAVGKNNEFQTLQTKNKIYEKVTVKHGSKLHGDDSANEAITKESPPTPSAVGVSQLPPPAGHDVNDFRPTAPGHSPGVGHAIEN